MSTDRDFPGGPVARSPSCDEGDSGSIPGWGTKILHTVEQLNHVLLESLCTAVREPVHRR